MTGLNTGRSEEERGLLRAIAAAPDDDVLRQAYTDWLEEHDRVIEARLHRVQFLLARLPVEQASLVRDRYQQLTTELCPFGARVSDFALGFPVLEIAAADFLAHADAIDTIMPVVRVIVYDADDRKLSELAGLPLLSQLQSLSIVNDRETALSSVGVRSLAESPHLARLRRLSIATTALGPEDAVELAGAPGLCGLSCLEVRTPRINGAAMQTARAIGAARSADRPLRELYLGTDRPDQNWAAFTRWPQLLIDRGADSAPGTSPPTAPGRR